jgi:hypothetical protein
MPVLRGADRHHAKARCHHDRGEGALCNGPDTWGHLDDDDDPGGLPGLPRCDVQVAPWSRHSFRSSGSGPVIFPMPEPECLPTDRILLTCRGLIDAAWCRG